MCIKYPAEIFIEITVCLGLSRSPGPSGSHYHSLSRIAIPDKTDKTLSNNLQLPPAVRQKHSSRTFLSLLMTSVTLKWSSSAPVTGRGLWLARVALSEDKRCRDLREPKAGIQMSATGPQKPWWQFFCLCLDLVTPDSWQCFVKGSESSDKELEEKKRAPT